MVALVLLAALQGFTLPAQLESIAAHVPKARVDLDNPVVRRLLKELPPHAQFLIPLAAVESGFNPAATSSTGARGLWQLMPATARAMGLVVDSSYDERLDPHRASVAALDYLLELHHQFGDWVLAFTAYHSGPGRVASLLAQVTDPHDIFALPNQGGWGPYGKTYYAKFYQAWTAFNRALAAQNGD